MYCIVTGVTSDVGVPSTYLVSNMNYLKSKVIDKVCTVTDVLYLVMLKMEGQNYMHCNQNLKIHIGSLEPKIYFNPLCKYDKFTRVSFEIFLNAAIGCQLAKWYSLVSVKPVWGSRRDQSWWRLACKIVGLDDFCISHGKCNSDCQQETLSRKH